jgi:hypothetical protein
MECERLVGHATRRMRIVMPPPAHHCCGIPARPSIKFIWFGVDGPRVHRRSVIATIVLVVAFIGLVLVLPGSALPFAIFCVLMLLVGLGGREVIRRSRD